MTNDTLIAFLKETGAVKTPAVERALRAVNRGRFVPEEATSAVYLDTALLIGFGQTISQPTVVAYCLERLAARAGDRVLDVGSGSGWTTALLAHIVGPTGSVIGLERIPELVSFGSRNLSRYPFRNARIEQAGDELGRPEAAPDTLAVWRAAPFDRILVSAAADNVPEELARQLADDGRMVIPIRNAICVIDHSGNTFSQTCREGFAFVPLIT